MRLAPYGPPDGLLFNAELPRLFRAWISIFKFLILTKRRRKNPFMRTRQTPDVTPQKYPRIL